MHTRGPAPLASLPPALQQDGSLAAVLIRLYFDFAQLKQLFRQGWLRKNIPVERCETVAEHTLGVAMLALVVRDAAFPELDAARLLRLALLHDLAEARVGDFTPSHGLTAAEKHRLEREGFVAVVGQLPSASEYLQLWEEYEARSSPEARLIHQLDRLEMALQASVYEQQGLGALEDFFASAGKVIQWPVLRAVFEQLLAIRSTAAAASS